MESFSDKSLYEMIQDLKSRVEALEGLRQQPQYQESLSDQMKRLIQIANRLGMYEAADCIKRFVTIPQRTGIMSHD
jgi:uncharacterized membrane protein YfbV (UPF0208 family)